MAAERRLAGLTAPHLIALSVKDTLLARQPGNDVPSCDYYYEVDTLQDPGVMRFCYRDDVLIEKSAYDMGSGVQGGDAAPISAFGEPLLPSRTAVETLANAAGQLIDPLSEPLGVQVLEQRDRDTPRRA
jgi:hypothetical protein